MRNKILTGLKSLLALFAIFWLLQSDFLFSKEIPLEKEEARIVRVVDGDTVDVERETGELDRVRLLLIDTPESVHPDRQAQAFGVDASDFAQEVLRRNKIITLELGSPERDKYDRLLAYIWIKDVNFNQLMIEKGYARVAYVFEPNTKYLKQFKRSQKKAQKNKLKIWSVDGYARKDGFDMKVFDSHTIE